jgi:Uma2 family endonuclease
VTLLLSFEEFEQLPDEPGKAELLDGELLRLPPAKRKHSELVRRIHVLLMHAVDKDTVPVRLGPAYSQTGYKFSSKVWFQPDVSIPYRDQPCGDYFESAPALAVEVISESNSAAQMDRKMKVYLANGGAEVWLVYPDTRCIWVYREGHAEGMLQLAIRAKLGLRPLVGDFIHCSTARAALRTSSSRISISRFVVR